MVISEMASSQLRYKITPAGGGGGGGDSIEEVYCNVTVSQIKRKYHGPCIISISATRYKKHFSEKVGGI